MPQQPHPVSGIVNDIDDSTVVEGVTVTAYDKNSGGSTTDITNASGAYVVDLLNLKNSQGTSVEYTIGGNFTIEGKIGNKIRQYRLTVFGDEQEQDITLQYEDVLGVIIDLLDDNWDKSTTDNIKPVIDYIFNQKEIDLSNNDYLLLYEVGESDKPFNIGGTRFEEISAVSIDARTSNRISGITDVRMHTMKIKEEIKRILKANLQDPAKPYQLLIPVRFKDLSDKTVGLGRFVMDYNISYWGS